MNYSMGEKKITRTFRLNKGILRCIDIIVKVLSQRGIKADKTKVIELAVMNYYYTLPAEEKAIYENMQDQGGDNNEN